MTVCPSRACLAYPKLTHLLLALCVAVVLLALPDAPTARADTQDDLNQARERAEKVRDRLETLHARAAWTNERLAYARDQLAQASSESVTAQQQFDQARGLTTDASLDLAHRVRAIEQSGGPLVLYSQAVTGSSITDVASNLAALSAILGTDAAAESVAMSQQEAAYQAQARLGAVADERAALVAEVRKLANQARALASAERNLLRRVNGDIRELARQLAKERAAERRAAAADVPEHPNAITTADSNPYAAVALDAAMSKLGSPYVWGDEGPDTFDCSGLVWWAYEQAGLVLPRLASDQYFASTPVRTEAMAPGDLLVYAYDTSDDETIHHITMYIGNGLMVHAPRTGDVVRVVPVYYDGLYGVGRPGL